MSKLSKLIGIDKKCQNCQSFSKTVKRESFKNCQTLSKLSNKSKLSQIANLYKVVKIVKNCQNCQNVGQFMSPHHFDQMSHRSLGSLSVWQGLRCCRKWGKVCQQNSDA